MFFSGKKMLREIIEKLGYIYVEVDPTSEEKILRLFMEGVVYEPKTANEFLYLGVYHRNKKNYIDSIVFYKGAVKLGNIDALGCIGKIYEITRDHEKAESFYKKGIELGSVVCLNLLAVFCENVLKDYDRAERYYKKGVKLGYSVSMFNLAHFYGSTRKNTNQSEIYYKMAVENDDIEAAFKLIDLYISSQQFETAFLFAYEKCKERLNKTIAALKYPISKQNRDKIYSILETLKPSPDLTTGIDMFYIMQDLVSSKVQILCEIAYHYKKYNSFYIQN